MSLKEFFKTLIQISNNKFVNSAKIVEVELHSARYADGEYQTFIRLEGERSFILIEKGYGYNPSD